MPSEPVRTLHILTSLNRRGAETFAILLVDRLNREMFSPAIWTIVPAEPRSHLHLVPRATRVLSANRLPARLAGYHALRHLVQQVRTFRPHLVQCHGGRALKYAMAARPFWRAHAYVYTKIGSVHPWLDPPLKHLFYRFLFEQLDAIIAVGAEVRREVEVEFAPRRPKLVTINTGRDVSLFTKITPALVAQARADMALQPSDVCVISVGSLSWEKDPLALQRVCAQIIPTHPEVKLVFVGDGPLRGKLQQEAERAGIAGSVRFLGVRGDVPALLSAADVFALPSATEGLPGVLIEAAMAGLPAVAFEVGSVREILQDGRTGRLVPPGDGETFRERLLEMVRSPRLRREMGGAAREMSRRDFDIWLSVRRHEALFGQLLRVPLSRSDAMNEPT